MEQLKYLHVIALFLPIVSCSRCNGASLPGPRNTHPIDTSSPVFLRAVPNGKLYSVGPPGDERDLIHLWGTPYENGVATGQLLGAKFNRFVAEVYEYTEAQLISNLANATWCAAHALECKGLRAITKGGLSAALDLSYDVTKSHIKPYVMEEIRGLADATKLSVNDVRNIMWIGELTRGSCSMFGAKGTATPHGDLLQLRALDWDVDAPFRNYATITVYHPNDGDGHAWANLAFSGFSASVTGFSSTQLGVSEIGVSYPDDSFGPESYLAPGYPFGFLIRDILQFDTTLDDATRRITEATRTCDLILGVGDGKCNDFNGFQYSPHVATVIKPDSKPEEKIPVNASWHTPLDDIVYWGMDWVCPNDNKMLSHQLQKFHGKLTPENTISDVVSYVGTGDLHIAIYDNKASMMYVATARKDGAGGPLNAYQRQFTRLNMTRLFEEERPKQQAPIVEDEAVATLPCDVYDAAGTPCVAAHSMVRALFGSYAGPLYTVKRSSDNTSKPIGVLLTGGFADIASQEAFCKGTSCTVMRLFDQSVFGNHIDTAPPGGAAKHPDKGVNASKPEAKLMVGGHSVIGAYFEGGMGYRREKTTGVATGDEPESMYMVTSGRHFNNRCCFDYGNAETDALDHGEGTMEAIYWGNNRQWGHGNGTGPWVMADLENGLWAGSDRVGTSNTPIDAEYVTAMAKGKAGGFALKGGDAQLSGGLKTLYEGKRPPKYEKMKKQGAIILAIGGDNSDWAVGTFYEGAMAFGYSSDETDAKVHASIVAAGYGR